MRLKLIFILIFVTTSSWGASDLDILNGRGSSLGVVSTREYCAECAVMSAGRVACSEVVNNLVNQTLKRTLYSTIVGNDIMGICLSQQYAPKISINRLDQNLNQRFGHEYKISDDEINSCLQNNKITFQGLSTSEENAKRLIVAYTHSLNRNILDSELETINQIAQTDALLNLPILDNIVCDKIISSRCEDLKKCHDPEALSTMAEFTLKTMDQRIELDRQKKELKSFYLSKKITKGQRDLALKEIEEKIKAINEMTPWLSGDVLRENLFNIQLKLLKGERDVAKKYLKIIIKFN